MSSCSHNRDSGHVSKPYEREDKGGNEGEFGKKRKTKKIPTEDLISLRKMI